MTMLSLRNASQNASGTWLKTVARRQVDLISI
ncbi:hypothetical protein ACLB1T_20485 [Escherichia coli]